jgi:DNA-binding NtrC family response regulator
MEFEEHGSFIIESFESGELCLENISRHPDVVILDYHLDGTNKNAMNGIQTLNKIKRFNADIPVVILSAQDKIEVAVNCMHHHAFDYVVKNETAFFRLQKIINNIFLYQKMEKELIWYMERM